MIKDSQGGVTTGMDGEYSLSGLEQGDVIVVSILGYETQEVSYVGQATQDFLLKTSTEFLDEVVVTALGIKRQEKALSYNVQEIDSEELLRVKDANFVNSLNGKVAGVTINRSSSGVGGATRVVVRGAKSIEGNNNVLYVIDGIPLVNTSIGTGNDVLGEGRATTEGIADFNPEDIESISVLSGPSAAALYGSSAANGVILITTKKGEEGKLSVSFSSTSEFSRAYMTPEFQNTYGNQSGAYESWGNELPSPNTYDPKKDFFETGMTFTNSLTLTTGNKYNQTYASISSTNATGIVPNNKYDRLNLTIRNTSSFLKDKLQLDLGASYVNQKDQNMVSQGQYKNPLVAAYLYPRGESWDAIRSFERFDPSRNINVQYWPIGDRTFGLDNPYWTAYRDVSPTTKNRYMFNVGLTYHILDWMNITARYRIDDSHIEMERKVYATSNDIFTEGSSKGLYEWQYYKDRQEYADVMLNINKKLGDFNLSANIGYSYSNYWAATRGYRGPLMLVPNLFSFGNIDASGARSIEENGDSRVRNNAVFANIEVGWKNMLYLTLTGRNDWNSRLVNTKNPSFFYPSVGASVVLTELMPNLNRDYLSYMKVRASFASVGTAFERYIANPRYEWIESSGQWSNTTQYPMYNLKPERTESWEVGLSMRFFKDFNLDLTYYNTLTKNQTFNPELGVSGYSKLYIQTGAVRNQGVELSLGYEKTWNKFTWNSNYTFSTNKNKIVTLADNAINPATGEAFSISTLNMGGLASTRFLLKEGGSMGDVYSNMDLQRDDKGNIYIADNGRPVTEKIANSDDYIKLGSVLPKANMAWRNSFSWKNFNFGFMVSARLGGVVFSRTQALLDDFGVSESTAAARDRGYVMVNGNDRITPENWYRTIGSGDAVAQYYTYSATNVRLQEASIGYTFPKKMLGDVCDLSISLVGRNLWMIYCKAPFDPESVASTENFYQGIDYFMMPSTRNIGCNVTLKF